jgi:hypothetical protein
MMFERDFPDAIALNGGGLHSRADETDPINWNPSILPLCRK